jgi:biopolymer transport protein ExbD
MEFERTRPRGNKALPLTALIDIMFILIIFFMLTTSFMKVESLELMLPSAGGKAATKQEVVHLFIQPNGDMNLGKRPVSANDLTESLRRMFEKDPSTKIMLLTADGVTMQQLVNIMDRIYVAGGQSLFVRKWENAPAPAAVVPADAEKAGG